MKRQLELLAPARNCDIGIAAIDCGADAVYIAGPDFGARQAAGNSIGEISRLCRHAHQFGARIFVTLNTILYDNETGYAIQLLKGYRDAGADAVIVQDLAIAAAAAEEGIDIPLHASTQCAIRTAEQARFYESLGFSRLVLERQLSIDTIRDIRKAVSCELEFFVHGALCVCYSGQCYLSEKIAGRSANRGECIQACRSRYDLADTDGHIIVRNKSLLSLKDLNLKDRMKELADAGITSFKIEGRLKSISYVKNVTRDYSIALDNIVMADDRYCRASFGKVSGGFTPDTGKTFNRGYTDLYIDGRRHNWASLNSTRSTGEEIGTVSFLNRTKDMLRISPAHNGIRLNNGDGFVFIAGSETVGFRGDICSGNEIRCKPVPELFQGAKIFRNLDNSFERELEKNMPVREIAVGVRIGISEGFVLDVTAVSEDGRTADIRENAGDTVASNRDRMLAVINSQLSKSTGHYRFHVSDLSYMGKSMDGIAPDCPVPLMPASFLNSIRRRLAEMLDAVPCRQLPMLHLKPAMDIQDDSSPADDSHRMVADYRMNIANRTAAAVYRHKGFDIAGMAYEIGHPADAELMRSRYCIRYELGMCPKQKKGLRATPLMLINNGRSLTVGFDCRNCEMTITEG